jgi:hypothetical protein
MKQERSPTSTPAGRSWGRLFTGCMVFLRDCGMVLPKRFLSPPPLPPDFIIFSSTYFFRSLLSARHTCAVLISRKFAPQRQMKSIRTRFMESSLKDSPTAKITYGGTINNQNGDGISFAVSSMLGRRNTQEDASAIETELRANDTVGGIIHNVLPGHALFAVFDGHGTGFASTYASTHFVSTLCKQPDFVMYSKKFFADIDNPQSKSKRKGMVEKSRAVDYRARDDTVEMRTLLEDAVKRTMIILDAIMLREITAGRGDRHEKRRSNVSLDVEHEELYDEFDTGTTAIIVIMTPQYIICANVVGFLLLSPFLRSCFL